MPGASNRVSQISVISRSLISIVAVICAFQLISFGLIISRSVETWQRAVQYEIQDDISRDLLQASDLAGRERNLEQMLLTGNKGYNQQLVGKLSNLRNQEDRAFDDAMALSVSHPDAVPPLITSVLADRLRHFRTLRASVDASLAKPALSENETTAYELSLATSDLISQTGLALHELSRSLASAPIESIGRLEEANYLLWQVRNQVSADGSALIERANMNHLLNASDETSLATGRELTDIVMKQLKTEMRFLDQFPLGYRASDLSQQVSHFQDLSTGQVRALTQSSVSPYTADAYLAQTERTQDLLHPLFTRLSATSDQQTTLDTQLASDRLLRYSLLLCTAIALNLALLIWLRRRVLRPLSLLSTINDAAREAIVLVDDNGRIFMANIGAENLFGFSARELLHKGISELLPGGVVDAHHLEELAQSGEEILAPAAHANGHQFHVSMIASQLPVNQNRKGTLVIIRNDQQRHLAEQANRQNLAAMSEITRIQNLIFTKTSRHQVFDELLSMLLAATRSDGGCLMEITESGDGLNVRCRAHAGLPNEEQTFTERDSMLAQYRQFATDPHWMMFPVALQDDQSGLIAVRNPQLTNQMSNLEPLLGLFASLLGFVSEEERRKQSAAQLHDVLRQQEALFSASPAGLIRIDGEARILQTNHHVCLMFGVEEKAIFKQKLDQLLNSPKAWAMLEQRIGRIREGKQAAPCELECRSRAGTQLWVLFEIRALYADSPQQGMIVSCIDITNLKNSERALREARDSTAQARGQLVAAIEAIPEAFAFYDNQDRLVVCNQHYADLFFANMTAEQMIGKTFDSLVRFSVAHAHELIEDGFDFESWVAERVRRHHQEAASFLLQIGDRWYQASDHRIPGLGSVCLRANITDLKAQEQELRQATIKADEANRAKSAFLASISHEIRTPLNGILGLLELLRLTQLESNQQDTLSSIQESAQTLLRLIDDILDFSKIEAGKLDMAPEPTAIQPLMLKVQDLYKEMASSKGLGFTVEIDPALAAGHLVDPLRLRQILQNFASNALKFTVAGQVSLRVQVEESNAQEQKLHFSCSDSGIGIAPEHLSNLFKPFTQAESSTTRRFGGTGLGLAICKRLAEQMGGQVGLESVPDSGTTANLWVTLQRVDDHQEAVTHPQPEAAVEQRINPSGDPILFVEDNPTNRKLTMMQLDRIGIAYKVAENGQEAFDLWQHEPFSLVLTDCHMPVMDGHQLAMAIRAFEADHPALQPIPIIACTANIGKDEAERAFAAGMNEVLTKPIGLDPLRHMLQNWLGKNDIEPAVAAAPERVSEVQIIDRATLDTYSQGDLMIELSILQDFLTSELEDLDAVRKAVGETNFKDTRWYTHRIKGAGRMVGALPLASAAEALENCAKQEAPLEDALAILEKEYRAVESWVAQRQQ